MHSRFGRGAALGAALFLGLVTCIGAGAETTLIVNASIVDGTGSPARMGAVRIDVKDLKEL